jgi:hypothetical protein
MGKGVNEIAMGVLGQALQRHGPARRIVEQALQLIASMRGHLGVGMQGESRHAGTAGTGQRGRLTGVAKPCADAPHPLSRPLAKGEALLHRGRQGLGQLGGVIAQGIKDGIVM